MAKVEKVSEIMISKVWLANRIKIEIARGAFKTNIDFVASRKDKKELIWDELLGFVQNTETKTITLV